MQQHSYARVRVCPQPSPYGQISCRDHVVHRGLINRLDYLVLRPMQREERGVGFPSDHPVGRGIENFNPRRKRGIAADRKCRDNPKIHDSRDAGPCRVRGHHRVVRNDDRDALLDRIGPCEMV